MTTVSEAMMARISVRAFKPDPVPEALVREILECSDPEKVVVDHLQRDGSLAGFGFPLYDAEDPRAVALLVART